MRKHAEREYCPNLRYENKLQKKAAQHAALDGAKDYGMDSSVITLHVILGQHESQNHTTSYALKQVVIQVQTARTLSFDIHKIFTSRRVLDRNRQSPKPGRTVQIHHTFRFCFSL